MEHAAHHVFRLYDYHIWANERVFRRIRELPEDVAERRIPSIFPSVAEVLAHLYVVDNIWLRAMQGDGFELVMASAEQWRQEARGRSVADLESLFYETEKRYRAFFGTLSDPDAVLLSPHPRFGTLRTTYADVVRHVVNHGTYHRGNIAAMLRQMGYVGTPTDYMFYLLETGGAMQGGG